MTGREGICPACLSPMAIDAGEVDKATPGRGYAPGNVATLCEGRHGCNQTRSRLQGIGKDWRKVSQYVSDVATASERVSVPSVSEAAAWWQARNTASERVSQYA